MVEFSDIERVCQYSQILEEFGATPKKHFFQGFPFNTIFTAGGRVTRPNISTVSVTKRKSPFDTSITIKKFVISGAFWT